MKKKTREMTRKKVAMIKKKKEVKTEVMTQKKRTKTRMSLKIQCPPSTKTVKSQKNARLQSTTLWNAKSESKLERDSRMRIASKSSSIWHIAQAIAVHQSCLAS
jgi:hypothetical protein